MPSDISDIQKHILAELAKLQCVAGESRELVELIDAWRAAKAAIPPSYGMLPGFLDLRHGESTTRPAARTLLERFQRECIAADVKDAISLTEALNLNWNDPTRLRDFSGVLDTRVDHALLCLRQRLVNASGADAGDESLRRVKRFAGDFQTLGSNFDKLAGRALAMLADDAMRDYRALAAQGGRLARLAGLDKSTVTYPDAQNGEVVARRIDPHPGDAISLTLGDTHLREDDFLASVWDALTDTIAHGEPHKFPSPMSYWEPNGHGGAQQIITVDTDRRAMVTRSAQCSAIAARLIAAAGESAVSVTDAGKETPKGGEGDNASEMVALTPDEQAFFDVLNDEPQTGSDIVAKLERQGFHHFDESKVSRISRREHMQTRGVRNRPRAGYYILQSNSNLTAK